MGGNVTMVVIVVEVMVVVAAEVVVEVMVAVMDGGGSGNMVRSWWLWSQFQVLATQPIHIQKYKP